MELEKQVCSLELAKKLKELGVKQESLFVWDIKRKNLFYTKNNYPDGNIELLEQCVAFSVAELGEMFPSGSFQIQNHKYGWTECCTSK